MDAANGAASTASPEAFRRAGATVTVIGAEPDGLNINDGYGSTHLEPLCAAVLAAGADLGIAHDGDADRCLAVDGHGRPVDGDQIMSVLAISLRDKGRLPADTLVATVMSNLGMLQAMKREAIVVRQTAVGDRYVLEDMKAGGYALGGEQSGHVIFLEHGTTGDGVLTGLMLAARVAETGRPLADLAGVMTRLPQVLLNVRGVDTSQVDTHVAVQARRRAGHPRARLVRSGPAAEVGHRAAGARHGRGGRRGPGAGRGGTARRVGADAPRAAVREAA